MTHLKNNKFFGKLLSSIMRTILHKWLNILILSSLLLSILAIKSEGVFIKLDKINIGTHHPWKIVLIFVVLWIIRLGINFKQKGAFINREFNDVWYRILVIAAFLWRAWENYFTWDRLMPDYLWRYFVVECCIFCTVYFLYKLLRNEFNPFAAVFGCSFLLWLYPRLDDGYVLIAGYIFLALSTAITFYYRRFILKKSICHAIVLIIISIPWAMLLISSFRLTPLVYDSWREFHQVIKFDPLGYLPFLLGLSLPYKNKYIFIAWIGGILSLTLLQNGGLLLSFYFPSLIMLFSVFSANGINFFLQNKITNKNIFDRNISLVIALLLFFNAARGNLFAISPQIGRSYYHWANLLHECGNAKPDKDGFYGYTTSYPKPPEPTAKYLAFGPYHYFFTGNYEAIFRLKLKNGSNSRRVCLLDISTDGGARILAQKELKGSDFKKTGQYQNFSLFFRLEKIEKLEFRVRVFGEGPLCLDTIRIIKHEG